MCCTTSAIFDYTPYITGIGGLFGGGLISYFVGVKLAGKNHAHSITLAQRQDFNKAGAEFRAVFVDTIYQLRINAEKASYFLSEIFPQRIPFAHDKAKIIFEQYLSPDQISAFNVAWEQYKNCEEEYAERVNPNIASEKYKKEVSQEYLNHIENLFRFASPK